MEKSTSVDSPDLKHDGGPPPYIMDGSKKVVDPEVALNRGLKSRHLTMISLGGVL
jgi:amino acid permease